jgi:hypothetical protein
MIYFVTENYLKTKTPITANIDVNAITPFISTQSDMRVQPILGTYFYQYILGKYNAQTLTPNEEVLVGYIQPVVAWRSAEDAVFGLSYQLKNKGLQTQNGDYSNSVSQSEISFSMEHYGQKASFYEARLYEYLKDNKDLFPEFTSVNNKDSDIKPSKDKDSGYTNSFMFI